MNHLIHETSPYLLQHAHNPVDWYAWKPEAFARAKAEDKPILVSIGYSTCHWCHVMERESFENQEVADLMNELFVCIKVDREERPDIDQIYMEACQIITGGGGWPLNCFLLPDGRPYFAGTYYPPQSAYGRPSWTQVLKNLSDAYHLKRDVVEGQANQLTDIIRNSDKNYVKNSSHTVQGTPFGEGGHFVDFITESASVFNRDYLDNVYYALRERFDRVEGGWGGAPKFPATMSIQFLLDYYFYTKNTEALEHAELSLQKMIQGGIYDQLGGGFARYATDRAWLIPHFEKMLYDNALLMTVLCDAYKLTKRDIYSETIEETLAFVLRDMRLPDGGFFSAYDADSEGVEGKFYVWQKAEMDAVLGDDSPLFCAFYDITEGGNWEETNILWRAKSYDEFATEKGIETAFLKEKMQKCRQKLFDIREKRVKPGLDDKILLSWNALMISAFAKAFEALGTVRQEEYRKVAVESLDFIFKNFKQSEGIGLYHTYKNGQAQYEGFLEDYAYLIEALLNVYGITFDKQYLDQAKMYADYTIENFFDESGNMFYFTSAKQADILLRKKDLYDSATPSGNATMVRNLQRLAHIFDDKKYHELSHRMLLSVADMLERYPSSFSKWAGCALAVVFPPYEIAVVGTDFVQKAKAINALFLPNKILMASVEEDKTLPLLNDRQADTVQRTPSGEGGQSRIYVCQNYACKMPVRTIEEMLDIL
ncbi:MAG: thioredoxin domain-containing protein [Saprospiraceae bacterium]|nr:thioredoxin domain-containing protein [Saprospiraceae bacterium]